MVKLTNFNPYSKEQQLGKKRSKNNRDFSPSTKQAIFERDEWKCVRCGSYNLESVPHHIIFKSQGGNGHKRNGASACIVCHRLAHRERIVRRWFEKWMETQLDERGDRR